MPEADTEPVFSSNQPRTQKKAHTKLSAMAVKKRKRFRSLVLGAGYAAPVSRVRVRSSKIDQDADSCLSRRLKAVEDEKRRRGGGRVKRHKSSRMAPVRCGFFERNEMGISPTKGSRPTCRVSLFHSIMSLINHWMEHFFALRKTLHVLDSFA